MIPEVVDPQDPVSDAQNISGWKKILRVNRASVRWSYWLGVGGSMATGVKPGNSRADCIIKPPFETG